MDVITQTDDLLAGPGEELPTLLRRRGLLPAEQPGVPIEAKALNARAAGPVFVHIDPRSPHVAAKGDTYAWRPSRINTIANPPELRICRHDDDFPYLFLLFFGIGANADAVVAVNLRVYGSSSHGVRISATNNPVTMIVTNGATAGSQVTVQVPLKSGPNPAASVFVELTLNGPNQCFSWYGADLRKL